MEVMGSQGSSCETTEPARRIAGSQGCLGAGRPGAEVARVDRARARASSGERESETVFETKSR